MEIQKVKITKDNTCVVVYSNADGDVITHQGGNIIHKDLREAMNAMIPHLAVLTEQREAYDRNLSEVKADDNLPVRLSVLGISISGDSLDEGVTITGNRMLQTSKVLNLNSPVAMLDGETDRYEYADDLYQLVENIKFEVRQYVEQKKWAIKQGNLFEDGDGTPFDGVNAEDLTGGVEIPQADIEAIEEVKKEKEVKKMKKTKKTKNAA